MRCAAYAWHRLAIEHQNDKYVGWELELKKMTAKEKRRKGIRNNGLLNWRRVMKNLHTIGTTVPSSIEKYKEQCSIRFSDSVREMARYRTYVECGRQFLTNEIYIGHQKELAIIGLKRVRFRERHMGVCFRTIRRGILMIQRAVRSWRTMRRVDSVLLGALQA